MKRRFFLTLFIISMPLFAQQQLQFHATDQIISFADYLFLQNDFLRASEQYRIALNEKATDTLLFRMAQCYLYIDTVQLADEYLLKISDQKILERGVGLRYKQLYKNGHLQKLLSDYEVKQPAPKGSVESISSLYQAIRLRKNLSVATEDDFVKNFFARDRDSISTYYKHFANPDTKNPYTAAILSAILPGAGKVYAGNFGDGVMSFITSGLFTYLAITNFQHEHNTRGYIFSGLGGLFYASNIYGSAAAAQIYNADYVVQLQSSFDAFISRNNCFIPEDDIEGLR